MKKVCIVFGLFFFFGAGFTAPKDSLRVQDLIDFKSGVTDISSVLTDETGTVFIEFPESVQANEKNTKTKFSGELLSPKQIEQPAKSPKTRMEEYFSFEITTAEGEVLVFTDRIIGRRNITQHERNLYPEKYIAGARPLLVFVTTNPKARDLSLWRFVNDVEGWVRIGGTQELLETGEIVFTVKMPETGRYTIFDEYPLPSVDVDSYRDEKVGTLAYLEEQYDFMGQQIKALKEAGVVSVRELQLREQAENEANQLITEENLFEDVTEFELDPNLFPDGIESFADNGVIPNATETQSINPTENFGLNTAAPLGELGLASITASPINTQARSFTTPAGETINQPIGATLPEAGVKNNWWSWNLFFLTLFLGAIIGGSYWVIKDNK